MIKYLAKTSDACRKQKEKKMYKYLLGCWISLLPFDVIIIMRVLKTIRRKSKSNFRCTRDIVNVNTT